MIFRKGLKLKSTFKRILSVIASISLTATILPVSATVSAADAASIMTDYQPTINEVIDSSGFKHPGIGLTKDILENLRTEVRAQKEPWNSYFNQMIASWTASKSQTFKNQSGADAGKPAVVAFNSQGVESKFRNDALTVYTQSILYYITGDETYRANALRGIRIWSQMDPAQYAYYTDACIHTGVALERMTTAAEIIRYSSCNTDSLAWTDDDTTNFINNLVNPVIETFNHTNYRFMNQHLYSDIAVVSGAIFEGNKDLYGQGVEWFTVNKTAVDQGQNGAIKQLFRLVDTNAVTGEKVEPRVQLVEMGRDQAHGTDDVVNVEILGRLLVNQGTKVDPAEGTVSTADNAVGPFEFLGNRILKGADYFAQFMLGYDPEWIPTASHTDASGNPTVIYKQLAQAYRGRIGGNGYDLYYYYKYTDGIDMEKEAPYFTEMFNKRFGFWWESLDAGGDYWLYIPKEAEAEGTKTLPKAVADPYREVEDRYTKLDSNSSTMQEGDTSFVRINATEAGSKIALVGYSLPNKTFGLKIRTNGVAKMDMTYSVNDTITLPDTKGQWKYVSYTMGNLQGFGDLAYFTVKGAGTTVDIDNININAGTLLTPPVFKSGNSAIKLFTYVGSQYTINYDFSAADSSSSDVVTYQIDNKPDGAVFDANTGAFSWNPTQAGTYSFVVEASDGTSITTKDVTVVVTNDRKSAVDAVTAPYNPNTIYISSTLDNYNKVSADVMSVMASVSDDVFYQKLLDLNSAVQGLQLLTPLLSDGSMNYTNLLASSTFGTQVYNLVDNSADSFAGYYLAQNRTFYMDFGPSYKVSASAFQLQVRSGFPERIGGTTIFGSNDYENWTRLTPGETIVTDEMQTLTADPQYQNQKFRFLKIQMIHPSSSMLEMSEFRIFGQRYETVNKLSSVSVSSDQSLKNRIVAGNTVKLAFQSTEPINNVNVTIQGQPATVTTTDNLNWTATLVVDKSTPAGTVKFNLNYKTAAGIDAEPTLFTTDGSSLFIADQTGLISNILDITSLSDSSGRNKADLLATAGVLFDNNLGSITDFRVNGSGYGGYLTFDFKEGGQVTLSKAEIISRQDQYYGRINGTVIQGSNDNSTWTTISNAAYSTTDWQILTVNSTQAYRYIRIYNGNNWYGNMAELRLYGVPVSYNKIQSVSISSDQSLNKRIVPGNTVKLSFTAKEPINNVNATIQGQPATVSTTDNINFTAVATLNQGVAPGAVKFAINYKLQDGTDGYPNSTTTDNTSLFLVDESDVIKNITSIANIIDPSTTYGRPNTSVTLGQVNNLFDSNLGTFSDFRNGSSGYGGYITFDFKAGNQATLTSVELLARQDQVGRMKYTVVQGSNDNSTWTDLTTGAASTADWQTFAVTSKVPYRYIRIYNWSNWYGNMAEVRFHGVVKAADVIASVTTDNAPEGWVNKDTTVNFNATDDSSGTKATYFAVDGGTQQTGSSVTLTTQGTHTLVYWSEDWASNVEQQHTATVKIDKTTPVTVATVNPSAPNGSNGWYKSAVTVNLSANDDASGVSSTEYSLDGGNTWVNYAAPVTVSKDGKYTLAYRSTDAAGNVETAKSISFNLDATTPEITVTGFESGNLSDANNIVPVVNFNDNLSGADSSSRAQVKLDGKQYQIGDTIQLYMLPLGTHTFAVNVCDMAGNTTSNTVKFITFASVDGLKQLVTRFAADNWIDNAGITNSLQSKLQNSDVKAFIQEVEAQSGKHVNNDAAGYLLRDARTLLP